MIYVSTIQYEALQVSSETKDELASWGYSDPMAFDGTWVVRSLPSNMIVASGLSDETFHENYTPVTS